MKFHESVASCSIPHTRLHVKRRRPESAITTHDFVHPTSLVAAVPTKEQHHPTAQVPTRVGAAAEEEDEVEKCHRRRSLHPLHRPIYGVPVVLRQEASPLVRRRSRGFGFVRYGQEADQEQAVANMPGYPRVMSRHGPGGDKKPVFFVFHAGSGSPRDRPPSRHQLRVYTAGRLSAAAAAATLTRSEISIGRDSYPKAAPLNDIRNIDRPGWELPPATMATPTPRPQANRPTIEVPKSRRLPGPQHTPAWQTTCYVGNLTTLTLLVIDLYDITANRELNSQTIGVVITASHNPAAAAAAAAADNGVSVVFLPRSLRKTSWTRSLRRRARRPQDGGG
ncbi:hypothetical protein B0T20DRAFT_505625 [Sordaria brevicollis]|uniref:Uncharacterized protein n=1 Tax=Sordaria brevicollis TaxID=83679 RepID=A0AAE0PGU2_SORBR|nr:hypothetical protein B0T20DRAFT_505625 [Sordaria brevicollis]